MAPRYHEGDLVVLRKDLPAHGLQPGDLGTVVHVYAAGAAYEVEFMRGDGQTIAVLTLEERDLRAIEPAEILHARPWAG